MSRPSAPCLALVAAGGTLGTAARWNRPSYVGSALRFVSLRHLCREHCRCLLAGGLGAVARFALDGAITAVFARRKTRRAAESGGASEPGRPAAESGECRSQRDTQPNRRTQPKGAASPRTTQRIRSCRGGTIFVNLSGSLALGLVVGFVAAGALPTSCSAHCGRRFPWRLHHLLNRQLPNHPTAPRRARRRKRPSGPRPAHSRNSFSWRRTDSWSAPLARPAQPPAGPGRRRAFARRLSPARKRQPQPRSGQVHWRQPRAPQGAHSWT